MQVDKLILTAGENNITLDFHPKLTVIAGLGRLERESLTSEIIAALAGHRAGVHLEITDDDGRHLAVFRPRAGSHKVVDVDDVCDVTPAFADESGSVNLLALAGIDLPTARRSLRFTSADLETSSQADDTIRLLAQVHQETLWNTAESLRAAERKLELVAQNMGSAPEDAEMVERIEQRHLEHELALAGRDRSRKLAFIGGGVFAALSAVFSLNSSALSVVFATLTLAMAAVAWRYQRRVDTAAEAEHEALAAAGAESYLGFHLQRVDLLVDNSEQRHQLLEAATDRRQAQLAWQAVAGESTVDFALTHRQEIWAAARVRGDIDRIGRASNQSGGSAESDAAEATAQALTIRLAEAAAIGPPALPLILDDPLHGAMAAVKPALLELISEAAGSPQLIFVTDDEEVASWARLEALTGNLSIVEPAPQADTAAMPSSPQTFSPA